MLRQAEGARRYNERIVLLLSEVVVDEYGHASFAEPVEVCEVYAYVRQMSASKTMMTFQQADVVGLDIEMRRPSVKFNALKYRGHEVHFAQPEEDERGRIIRISGWYQTDDPKVI